MNNNFNTKSKYPSKYNQQKIVNINDIKIKEEELFTNSIINSKNNPEIFNIQISCFAYWKVFEKRFADYCEMIILNKLVYFYQRRLGLMLEKRFSPSITKENYITEDISITRRRHEILDSLKRLESAKENLGLIL